MLDGGSGLARQQRQNGVDVLVGRKAQYTVETAAFVRPVQLFGHVCQSVRVMPRVAQHLGLLAQRLPASLQCGHTGSAPRAVDKGAAADRQRRLLMQQIERGERRQDVVALVPAQPVEIDIEHMTVAAAHHAEMLLVAAKLVSLAGELPFGIDHARFVHGGGLFEHRIVGFVRFAQHEGDALLDDTRLLGGDLSDRIAQQRRMIQSDVGHHTYDGQQEVRGVEPPAESRLDDRYLDIALRKIIERQRRRHLKERKSLLGHLVAVLVDEIDHLLLGDHFAVDTDALAEVVQMGRGEESRAVTGLLQYGGDDVRNRSFAVGSRNVNREIIPLRISQMPAESRDAFQTRFVGRDALFLKRRHRREKKFERL